MKRIKVIKSPNTIQLNEKGKFEYETGSGSSFVLEPATDFTLGGVKARPKTEDDIIAVSIDKEGRLWIPENDITTPEYVLKVAGKDLGGVRAESKTAKDTIPVRVDSDGMMWVEPQDIPEYEYPKQATTDTLGLVKVSEVDSEMGRIGISETGVLGFEKQEIPEIPIATMVEPGLVKVVPASEDMTDYVGISPDGMLKVHTKEPEKKIPLMTISEVGGAKAPIATEEDTELVTIDDNGFLRYKPAEVIEGEKYVLPQATETTLGGVKANPKTVKHTEPVTIGSDGKLYVEKVEIPDIPEPEKYVLPQATETTLGGVKVKTSTPEDTEIVTIDSNTGYLKYKAVAGKDGKDGLNGKDGKDGLNADQLPDPIIHTEKISPDSYKLYLPFTREIIIGDETKVFANSQEPKLPQTLTVYKSGKFTLEVPYTITTVPNYDWIDKINIEYQNENSASNFRNLWGLAKQFYDFAEVSTGTTTLAWSIPGKASTSFTDVNYLVSNIYQPIPAKLLDRLMYKFTGTFPKEILDLFI